MMVMRELKYSEKSPTATFFSTDPTKNTLGSYLDLQVRTWCLPELWHGPLVCLVWDLPLSIRDPSWTVTLLHDLKSFQECTYTDMI